MWFLDRRRLLGWLVERKVHWIRSDILLHKNTPIVQMLATLWTEDLPGSPKGMVGIQSEIGSGGANHRLLYPACRIALLLPGVVGRGGQRCPGSFMKIRGAFPGFSEEMSADVNLLSGRYQSGSESLKSKESISSSGLISVVAWNLIPRTSK